MKTSGSRYYLFLTNNSCLFVNKPLAPVRRSCERLLQLCPVHQSHWLHSQEKTMCLLVCSWWRQRFSAPPRSRDTATRTGTERANFKQVTTKQVAYCITVNSHPVYSWTQRAVFKNPQVYVLKGYLASGYKGYLYAAHSEYKGLFVQRMDGYKGLLLAGAQSVLKGL